MKRSRFFLPITVLIFVCSCNALSQSKSDNKPNLVLHIQHLASDDLQGRFPGPHGDSMAGD